MILAGLLTAEPIGKDLALGLDFEPGNGGAAPPAAWGKPGEGAGADIKAEELRQKMVVGRGAMAAQRGEILLMAEDLVASEARVLEAFGGSRPATEKAAGPGEADQGSATSMPLDQWIPVRNGFACHHERSCAAASSA